MQEISEVNKAEKLAALQLTATQLRAFNKMKDAMVACEDAGIVFIAEEEFHYAFNGAHLEHHDDYGGCPLGKCDVHLRDAAKNAPHIVMEIPYINCSVAITVSKEGK